MRSSRRRDVTTSSSSSTIQQDSLQDFGFGDSSEHQEITKEGIQEIRKLIQQITACERMNCTFKSFPSQFEKRLIISGL